MIYWELEANNDADYAISHLESDSHIDLQSELDASDIESDSGFRSRNSENEVGAILDCQVHPTTSV